MRTIWWHSNKRTRNHADVVPCPEEREKEWDEWRESILGARSFKEVQSLSAINASGLVITLPKVQSMAKEVFFQDSRSRYPSDGNGSWNNGNPAQPPLVQR